jgi:hypothetical protein
MQIIRSGVKTVMLGAMAILIVQGSGCKENKEEKAKQDMLRHNDDFQATDDSRSWKQFANLQSAAGAQEDASLSSEHFTGGKLNALGQEKLKLMMQGGVQPAVVYLGTADDATTNLRRAAIDEFLRDSGAGTDALVVKSGFNPRLSTPVTENISRMGRAESAGTAPQGTSSPGSTARGGTTTGGGGTQ